MRTEDNEQKKCVRCGLTAAYKYAEIDDSGVCKYCRDFTPRSFRGRDGLLEDVSLEKGERIGVNVSGGKDSIYMWGVLAEMLGAGHITAFCYYRPGITSEVAMRNVRRTAEILGTELVVIKDEESYERFRQNFDILLKYQQPEMVRVLLCAGCRYGITERIYEEGRRMGINKFFSGASYLELAPFKEELIACRSASGDEDEGLRNIIAGCPEMDFPGNLEVIERDNQLKYKNNSTGRRKIAGRSDMRLYDFDDYFENDPERIEEIVIEKYGWEKTSRSWHFDCRIEDIKDAFYYGLLGYTEMDFKLASMVRHGLISREESLRSIEEFNRKLAYSYFNMLEILRKCRLSDRKDDLDRLYRESPYLISPPDIHEFSGKIIHMIGIGGASMCGIADMLTERGYTVTGSDMIDGASVRDLREKGLHVTVGHSAENVQGAGLVVYSMAVPDDHVELAEARRLGLPIIERSVLLGQISSEYGTSISVCGTHGKTTTVSMLAQILVGTGMDPTVHIGGVLDFIGGSVRTGKGDIFLTESCEYRRNFMNLTATAAILTGVDTDHLDYYKDIDEIESSFADFLGRIPEDGWVIGCGDDERALRILKGLPCNTETFGRSSRCDYRIDNYEEDTAGYASFDMYYKDSKLGTVNLSVPGDFNAMNALAALAAAHHFRADMSRAIEIMGEFTGAKRRFEKTGELQGAELFHDYGHNPAEMRNAISIARKRCTGGKLWAVIQPHTFSRVKTMFDEYLTCAEEADVVLVTDIFAAREPDPGDINSGMLVDAMKKRGVNAELTPAFEDAAERIRSGARRGDLVITLGCGNIYMLNEMLAEVDDE